MGRALHRALWAARHGFARGIAALGVASLPACAALVPSPPAEPPLRHGVESARLAGHMRELDELSRERLPQAMDLGQERNRRLYQVARVASAIAESASLLEDAVSAAPLTRDERRAFAKHAEALRSRARTLAEQAQHLSPTAIRARAAQLEETCAGCHQRFRIPRTARD